MSKNIKDISKKLLGQSLNSFHRKTGLTQLEKNNEMQDGVLNGILSQVDNAYIEKTEQSNVIHLDGSGDGVVVVDSIEGNTMVNLFPKNHWTSLGIWNYIHFNTSMFSVGKKYTIFVKNIPNGYQWCFTTRNVSATYTQYTTGHNALFNYDSLSTENYTIHINDKGVTPLTQSQMDNIKVIILEGDYTNQDVNYFEGLQSSFEEKVNDEGKYEIEILSNNENLFDFNKENYNLLNTTWSVESDHIKLTGSTNNYSHICGKTPIRLKPNTDYTFFIDGYGTGNYTRINIGTEAHEDKRDLGSTFLHSSRSISICYFRTDNTGLVYIHMYLSTPQDTVPTNFIYSCGVVQGVKNITQIKKQKQNKIKLLINEPLRAIGNKRDKLCVKDGRLVIERRCGEFAIDKNIFTKIDIRKNSYVRFYTPNTDLFLDCIRNTNNVQSICDKRIVLGDIESQNPTREGVVVNGGTDVYRLMYVAPSNISTVDMLNDYFIQNPITIIYPLITS